METPFVGMLDMGSWGVVPVPWKSDKKQSALASWSMLHKEPKCVGASTLVKLLPCKTKRKRNSFSRQPIVLGEQE